MMSIGSLFTRYSSFHFGFRIGAFRRDSNAGLRQCAPTAALAVLT
jgi:hypothetical protein